MEAKREHEGGGLRVLTLSDLEKLVSNESYLVSGGILPERGHLVIGGPYKSGKSWLATQAACELANGMSFLGTYAVSRPRKVLYLDAENGAFVMHERLTRMKTHFDSTENLGIVTGPVPLLDTPQGRASLKQTLDGFAPDVVIIDPLYRFHTGDENSAQDMGRVMSALDELTLEFGVAIIVLHHTHKPQYVNGKRPPVSGDNLRGSTVLPGWATGFLMLEGGPDQGKLTITPTLRSARPEPIELAFDEELGIFRPKDTAQDDAIIAHIRDAGGSMPMPDLKKWVAELLSRDDRTAERHIKKMKERGKLEIAPLDGKTNLVRLPMQEQAAA